MSMQTDGDRPTSRRLGEWLASVWFGCCGLSTLALTVVMLAVVIGETLAFFQHPGVSVWAFLTGDTWLPAFGRASSVGVWPLLVGTFAITAIALLFAGPLGLLISVYLSEFASARARAWLRPALLTLAVLPTVVIGFFALRVLVPGLQLIDATFESANVVSAGLAVGFFCLPPMVLLMERAMSRVPAGVREGGRALGATGTEVVFQLVMPAAKRGMWGAFILVACRAMGETVIVTMAAGGVADLQGDLRGELQPITGYIAKTFLDEGGIHGPAEHAAYTVALLLWVMTAVLSTWGFHWLPSRGDSADASPQADRQPVT